MIWRIMRCTIGFVRTGKETAPDRRKTKVLPPPSVSCTLMLLAGIWAVNPGSGYLPSYWSDYEFFEKLPGIQEVSFRNPKTEQT